jgi:transposase
VGLVLRHEQSDLEAVGDGAALLARRQLLDVQERSPNIHDAEVFEYDAVRLALSV